MSPPASGSIGRNLLKFAICLLLALGLQFALREPGFTDSQTYVLFLLFFAVGLWVTEAIPPFAVGLFVIAFLVFALGNPHFNAEPQDIAKYVNTFSSRVVWLMLGGFFLAEAMRKTGLDADLFRFALKVAGTRPRRVLLALMVTGMFASMLMSNTACTAMLIASVMPLLVKLGKGKPLTRALLIGIPLASSIGGMGTLIGTPPNLIAAGVLESAGIEVSFVQWLAYGLPLAIVLTAAGWLLLVVLFLKDNEPIVLEAMQERPAGQAGDVRKQRIITLVVTGVTLFMWVTSGWHNVSVSAVSAIPIVFLTMTRVIQGSDVRALGWDTLLLVAGGLSLGIALQETGLLKHYAGMIAGLSMSQMAMIVVMAYASLLFSNVVSHTAASTVLVPLGMALVPGAQLEVALVIALASSTALMLPVSTPPNAVAYATGLLDQKDLLIGGIAMGLLGPVLIILWVLLVS